jgi:hypothetical protein
MGTKKGTLTFSARSPGTEKVNVPFYRQSIRQA